MPDPGPSLAEAVIAQPVARSTRGRLRDAAARAAKQQARAPTAEQLRVAAHRLALQELSACWTGGRR